MVKKIKDFDICDIIAKDVLQSLRAYLRIFESLFVAALGVDKEKIVNGSAFWSF